jgi:putative Mg2+ transporter-C (MgtC) family protein
MTPHAWEALPRMLLNLAVAFVVGLPVGWEREHRSLSAGLRTFPLVSMGACAYLQIGEHVFRDSIDAQARVFQALVSGIGFIGAGAIIKGRAEVHGLATAVALWVTVSAGIAVAYELYVLSIALSVTTLLALQGLRPLKEKTTNADKPSDRRSEQ